jgi:hypothetical protein
MMKLATLLTLLFASTLTVAQSGGFWNFTLPYGPPTTASTITLGTAYVNQINLANGTSADVAGVNFYANSVGVNAVLNGCLYPDNVSGPIWQASYQITAKGPAMMNAPVVTIMAPPVGAHYSQPVYWLYFETATAGATIEGFQTNTYPQMQQILNYGGARWWSSPWAGTTCPASISSLTETNEPSVDMAAFYLHP